MTGNLEFLELNLEFLRINLEFPKIPPNPQPADAKQKKRRDPRVKLGDDTKA